MRLAALRLGALLRQRARWRRLGFRHAPSRAAASVDPFVSRVTGQVPRVGKPLRAPRGPSRLPTRRAAPPRPAGPYRPSDRRASTERMRALREQERRGLRRFTIGASEDDLPRDCGARLRRRRKRRSRSAGASRQPLHHRHARRLGRPG